MTPPRALVTGASSGIGREVARELAIRGWDLDVVARSEDALHALAEDLARTHGATVRVRTADLADETALETLAHSVLTECGPPDLLALVAGVGHIGPWTEMPAVTERAMLRLNVEAPTRLARHMVPAMVERGAGRVMAVSSLGAFLPGPGMAVYYATRSYVLTWARSLAEELRGSGVTVSCVCPGPVPTGFQERAGFGPGGRSTLLSLSAERVARVAVDRTLRGRALVIPGWKNRLVAGLARLLPWRWSAPLVHRVMRRRERGG